MAQLIDPASQTTARWDPLTGPAKGDSKKEADETFYLDLFGNSTNSLFTKNAARARS